MINSVVAIDRNRVLANGGVEMPQVIGELVVDRQARKVKLNDEVLQLTHKEFELISYLAKNLDQPVSRDILFENVWGYQMDYNTNSLDVYIYRVRRKIEADPNHPRYLRTVRGFGYRMVTS